MTTDSFAQKNRLFLPKESMVWEFGENVPPPLRLTRSFPYGGFQNYAALLPVDDAGAAVLISCFNLSIFPSFHLSIFQYFNISIFQWEAVDNE